MAGPTRSAGPGSGSALDLLPLAAARPGEALAKARALLATHPGPIDASAAHQTIGIVLRDFGDAGAALRELRAAQRLARVAGSSERQADVLATLGVALVQAGRTAAGLSALEDAAAQAAGAMAGRVRYRHGATLWVLGRHPEALDELRRAVAVLRRVGDTLWEARALTARGLVHLAMGSAAQADADFGASERLFMATSQDLEVAYSRHNRALTAFASGDLPSALRHLDEAGQLYAPLAAPMPDLAIDRCAVLLAAGLPGDALREVDAAIGDLERARGQTTKKAELLLAAAGAALAAADPQAARRRAEAACRLFGAQQRTWWHAHAAFLVLRARYASGEVSGRLLRQAEQAAGRLAALGSGEAPRARLLAGRVALALGRAGEADRHLAAAARARRRGPVLSRASGWLAEALRAEAAARPRRVFSACRRGLGLLDEHQLTLGASELRALATMQGTELAALAQRHALQSGRPRLLLAWSERWRATALAIPPARPAGDRQLRADLTALRDVTRRLDKALAQGAPAATHRREQLRLEAAIRARAMRVPGTGGTGTGFDPAVLLAELGSARLIHIATVGGDLHALVCAAGKVRQFAGGREDDAAREVDYARFGLSRLAHAGPKRGTDDALAMLEQAGRRLEAILLGQAARHLGDGPLIVVPPGRLHAVPWALLPSLRDRVLSVSPSARAWLRALAVAPPQRQTVVLVQGPGLANRDSQKLAAPYDDVISLGGGSATAARVLRAIDGARLVHIAAHGTFRADNPQFSALRLDDGPLTVHDFGRLRRAPHRLILASCGSALLAPSGADELLGLTATLVPLGTAGIIASVVPVNDKAAARLMLALHHRLMCGGTLAQSLRDARRDLDDDPVQTATGWSFVALGAR